MITIEGFCWGGILGQVTEEVNSALAREVADPQVTYLNAISAGGLLVIIGLAWLMSSHRERVNWRLVTKGLLLQLAVGLILFQSQQWDWGGRYPNGILFAAFDSFFAAIKSWADVGGEFVFRVNASPEDQVKFSDNPVLLLQTFAMGVMPTVIFFSALMSVLYYLGVMQVVVRGMAWVMQRTLGTTGPESLAAAANVFVGHTEAPLVIRPYVNTMTRSELNALMVGGFSTITGGLMAVFVGFGVSAGHLVVASIISAPAALVIAKILQPETEAQSRAATSEIAESNPPVNVLEAAANGASDGLKLALNIVGMLIAFLALVAMVDSLIGGLGELAQQGLNWGRSADQHVDLQWSLGGLFALVFYPLACVMGIEGRDCWKAGELLGTKTVVNEFVAYMQMGEVLSQMRSPDFDPARDQTLSDRSVLILTYALCGFSNFGAIGIQLGGIGALAPERRSELAQLGLRAMLGGMLACCATACVAGILYGFKLFG